MEIDLVRIKCRENFKNNFIKECHESVLHLRYNVYHEEMHVIPPNDLKKVDDKYDYHKSTVLFVAMVNNEVAGTLRLVKFDFNHKLPLLEEHIMLETILCRKISFDKKIYGGRVFSEAGRFVLLKDYRRNNSNGGKLISFMLMKDYTDYCKDEGITDIIGVANPKLLTFYNKIGFYKIYNICDKTTGIESPIIHGEVDIVAKMINRVKIKIQLIAIINSFIRRFKIFRIK